jgi:hypothetical protein
MPIATVAPTASAINVFLITRTPFLRDIARPVDVKIIGRFAPQGSDSIGQLVRGIGVRQRLACRHRTWPSIKTIPKLIDVMDRAVMRCLLPGCHLRQTDLRRRRYDPQDFKEEISMAVTLNRRAYEHAGKLISEGRVLLDDRDVWSEHRLRHRKQMTSFASMVFPNTASGIWASTTKRLSRPRGPTNSLMAISGNSTAAACSPRKAGRANTSTTTSNARQRICMACWMAGRVRRLRSAQRRHR